VRLKAFKLTFVRVINDKVVKKSPDIKTRVDSFRGTVCGKFDKMELWE